MLFDQLDPNDERSLNIFFTSKYVFANADIVAARIKDSTRSAAFKENSLRLKAQQSEEQQANRLVTLQDLSVANQVTFD